MDAKEYIKERLQQFSNKFLNIKLSYLYDNVYVQHVIVITPALSYSDEFFAKEQVIFELEFIEHFPYESLYFVPNGELEISEPFDFETMPKVETYVSGSKFNVADPQFNLEMFNSYLNSALSGGSSIVNTKIILEDTASFSGDNSYAMAA